MKYFPLEVKMAIILHTSCNTNICVCLCVFSSYQILHHEVVLRDYVCTTFDGKNNDLDCKDIKPVIAKFLQDLKNILKKTDIVLQL